jgi:hypothetical protein
MFDYLADCAVERLTCQVTLNDIILYIESEKDNCSPRLLENMKYKLAELQGKQGGES